MTSYKKTVIKDKGKYILFSQLHSLLSSGLNFSHSFELLIQGEEKKKETEVLKEVYNKILVGNEFWKSLEMSGAFTELDYGVIRIGEETGKIDQALMFLSDYYQKKNEQKRMLMSALSYPLIIIITAFFVLLFMITVVVPMFEQVYSRMGGESSGNNSIHYTPLFPISTGSGSNLHYFIVFDNHKTNLWEDRRISATYIQVAFTHSLYWQTYSQALPGSILQVIVSIS